jgi:hypothetical protein
MSKTAIKLSIGALLFYIGCFVARHLANLPPDPLFAASDMPPPGWDYLSLASFIVAVALSIAALKLRKH